MTETRIYLSGGMSGLPDNNRPAFHAEAARLRAQGHYVVNPAEIDLDEGATWSDYMRADLVAMLSECNTLVMLQGWEQSKGANLEWLIAKALGFEITYADAADEVAA